MPKQFLWRPISITPTKAGKKTKIHVPQPEYKALQLNKRDVVRWEDVNMEVDWFTLHRRGVRRPKVGEDPLEMRAVPHGYIKGTLPERIVYYYLTNYMRFQAGVDFDFQCLAGHHKVVTKDLRWVQIKDLKVGDELLNLTEDHIKGSGRDRAWETGTVTHNEPFISDAYEVTLSNGKKIIATPEHPWLINYSRNKTKGGWLRGSAKKAGTSWMTTDKLKIGYHVPVFLKEWETDTSYEAGWVAGFFDGEGSVLHGKTASGGHSLSLTMSQNAGSMFDRAANLTADLGFNFSVYDYREKYSRSYDDGMRQVMHMRIAGGRSEALRFLGTIRPAKLDRLNYLKLGKLTKIDQVQITNIKFIGKHEMYKLAVSNKTYFCEGLAMHNSSLEGGRMEIGGMVVDFLFPQMRIIIQVQGPTHDTFLRKAKDNQQIDDLAKMGYTVYELDDQIIYDEYLLEEWMRRTFSLPAGVGGSGGAHGSHEGDLTDVEILYQRVLAVQQHLINYFGV